MLHKIIMTFNNNIIQLVKPKIIFGNIISLTSGFLLASQNIKINYFYFFNIILGVICIIASSCIFNNIIDRDIDQIMLRTKNRIIIKNFSFFLIIIYGSVLFFLGFFILFLYVNKLSLYLTLLGFIIYVIIYSKYMKRKSIYSIPIGSISGALPPVIGYYTAQKTIDYSCIMLFFTFIFWQIAHSYAIVMYYFKDYKKAKIPTVCIVKGFRKSKIYIIKHIIIFNIFAFFLYLHNNGYVCLLLSMPINLYWLFISFKNYKNLNYNKWSHKVFIFSIVTIMTLNFSIILDSLLYKINKI